VDELVEETRLPDARLADEGDYLTVALARALQRAPQLLQLSVAPHEPREPARRRAFEPRPHGARAHDFIDVDRLAHALDLDGSQRLDGDVALGRRRVSGATTIDPGAASCSIRAARWVVWPTAV
jgi:hypothetical protein